MRVADAIELMTKAMLQRVVDSFTKDFPKSDEERAREIILRNTDELTDPQRIEAVLSFDGRLQDQIRQTCVLEALIRFTRLQCLGVDRCGERHATPATSA